MYFPWGVNNYTLVRTWCYTPHVSVVATAGHEKGDAAAGEHRCDDGDVGKVGPARQLGVV